MNNIETVLFVVTIIGVVFFSGYTLFFWQSDKGQISGVKKNDSEINSGHFTVNELAKLESSFPNLRRVIVVAHKIEQPENGLKAAVKQNFANHVKYLFLISKDTAEAEKRGYFTEFQKIENEVKKEKPHLGIKTSGLTEIQRLPYNWDDVPYIFFEVAEAGIIKTYAVCGDQEKQGIADGYYHVSPNSAQTIAKTIMSGAPEPIKEELTFDENQFPDDILSATELNAGVNYERK